MNAPRDDMQSQHEVEDLAVDHLLQQELGGHRPRDFAARIAAANDDERRAAAAKVDAASELVDGSQLVDGSKRTDTSKQRRTLWLAAAAALTIATGTWFALHGAAAAPTPATMATRGQALLDAFHAAMPRSPVELRDAHRRAAAAERALPVIRELLALHAADPRDTLVGHRSIEFEIYALELGDRAVRAAMQARADRGDADAAAALQIAALATADASSRDAALARVVSTLPNTKNQSSLVRGLETADLSVAEADLVAEALADPVHRVLLRHSAALAAESPRRLLGQPLEVVGRRVDDRVFSSASLKGRVVVVCFWATWCRPSHEAMGNLRTLRERHPELEVVAVSCDHDPRALRGELAEHGDGGFVHLFDRSRPGWHELANAFGVRMLPTLLWLDRRGIVREIGGAEDAAAAAQRLLGR